MSAKESGGGFYLYGNDFGILAKNITQQLQKIESGKHVV